MTEPQHRTSLEGLGWDETWAETFGPYRDQGFSPGRIGVQHRSGYGLLAPEGTFAAEITGKLHYLARTPADLPIPGDWVAASLRLDEMAATIHEVLPRRTRFSRQVAGEQTAEQAIAANIDLVFIVSGLDRDLNPRRLERYLLLARAGEATPVFLLNKADLVDDLEERLAFLRERFAAVPLLPLSARAGTGLEAVRELIRPGTTAALIGSSGVGKSTLINRLLGHEAISIGEVREADGRGRHTTTRRELHLLPGGGLVLDTPGLRELQLWGEESDLQQAFPEIEELSRSCRYRDCRHDGEPGCAVQAAVENNDLSADILMNYHKLQKELAWQERRRDPVAREARNKQIARLVRDMKRHPKRP